VRGAARVKKERLTCWQGVVIGSNNRVKQISQVRRSRSSLSSFAVAVGGWSVCESVPQFSVFRRLRGGGESESVVDSGERGRR
jgi:hypothetical protein